MDKSWMRCHKDSDEYKNGVKDFIAYLRIRYGRDVDVWCPCKNCRCSKKLRHTAIAAHLLLDGIDVSYDPWIFHGEDPTFVPPKRPRGRPRSVNWIGDEIRHVDHPIDLDVNDDGEDVGEILDDLEAFIDYQDEDAVEGDTFNIEREMLHQLKGDSHKPLYPGCTKYSRFSFIVQLLHLKVYNKWSNKSFDMLLQLMRDVIPNGESLPKSTYAAHKYLRGLGMGCHNIHACEYDCCLYWGVNEKLNACPVCGTSRYKVNDGVGKPIPHKVLRYFPLKPRLQRLFVSSKVAPLMTWHKNTHKYDGVSMSHPADSESWRSFDNMFPWFAREPRNVRLALASDGFNPFGSMSHAYSMWPVVLLTYNLPPWMCMKKEYFILSLLIPGPRAPGKEIDVYLQPLIDELKDLWENGLMTFDATSMDEFRMHAALMWTINDFPAYGNLSGWSTKGYYACPVCKEQTPSLDLRNKIGYVGHRCWLPQGHRWRRSLSFDGEIEARLTPLEMSGDETLHGVSCVTSNVILSKHPNFRRRRDQQMLNWTKKSILFQLPYWSKLKLRHNLDVMHVEKNICDNLLGTMFGIDGKSKDTIKARLDLEDMGIRSDLHLRRLNNGKYSMPRACYSISPDERQRFCEFLKGVKLPDGYASHIGRCVNLTDRKITGLKSHDCHVLLQRLLPVGIRGLLTKDVTDVVSELGEFFERLCQRTLMISDLHQIQDNIVMILCKLEMIFPPAFFDVMVHLAVHLPREALLGGPVAYRWMYPIERYLGTLKQFVRNRARPEGSIAEAYMVHECLTWCSMHLSQLETAFNRPERNVDHVVDDELCVFKNKVGIIGQPKYINLTKEESTIANWYILNNCPELDPFKEEHKVGLVSASTLNVEKRHKDEFTDWFKNRMLSSWAATDPLTMSLYTLAMGHDNLVKSYSGLIVNGVRFHTISRDSRRKTQNSGVLVDGDSGQVFYGVIEDILEITYRQKGVFLFKCKWWDLRSKANLRVDGTTTSINVSRTWYHDDPFILASQAKQVFYLGDMRNGTNWRVVQRFMHRHIYNMTTISEEANMLTDVEVLLADDQLEETFRVENAEGLPIFVVLDCDFHESARQDVEPDVVDEDRVNEIRGNVGLSVEDDDDDLSVTDDTLIDYDSSDDE